MKLTKRLFTLLLALLMASACFVGCSGDDNHNDDDDDKNNTSAEIKDDDQNGKDDNTNSIPDIILPHEHTYSNGVCTVCGEAKPSEGLKYTLNADGESYSLSDEGSCQDAHIVIPATYNGKPVTDIASGAFWDERNIEGIIIPDSVTGIGSSAFHGCTSLTSITIPDSVTSIGDSAFIDCSSLASIVVDQNNKVYHSSGNCLIETASKTLIAGCKASVIPSDGSVTSIGDWAFYGCNSLTSINIPKGVTSIGKRAFYFCSSLTSITIPDGVTTIGDGAFSGCTSLKYNEYKNGKYLGNSNNPCVVLCDVIDTGVSSFEINARTKFIGDSAFEKCSSLTSITIPDSVTSIGYSAFSGCRWLKSVTIPDSVMIISGDAFRGCSSLKSITIPDSVTSIGERVFDGCFSLVSITVDKDNPNYHSAGNCLIETESKTLIKGFATSVIPTDGSVTHIGNGAFYGCNFTSISIPESVTSIGETAFFDCDSLTSIVVDKNNKVYHSAGNCIIETASKTLIAGCKASVIPSDGSVTSIGDWAFYGCNSLTSITIPESVTSIGNFAFGYCNFLTSINYGGTIEQWNAVDKYVYRDNSWNANTGDYTVHCTDGDIAK